MYEYNIRLFSIPVIQIKLIWIIGDLAQYSIGSELMLSYVCSYSNDRNTLYGCMVEILRKFTDVSCDKNS